MEVLVAGAISVGLAGLLMMLAGNILANGSRAQSRLSAEVSAQEIFDMLTLDLQGAVVCERGGAQFAATVQANTSVSGQWRDGGKPAAGSLDPAAMDFRAARFGRAGVWLRFFAFRPGPSVAEAEPAAPVAVSYQIIRRPLTAGGGAIRYLFYRAEIDPSVTLAAGFDLGAPAYVTPSDIDGSVGRLASPAPRQVLAANVVDFGIRIFGVPRDAAASSPRVVQIFPGAAGSLEYMVSAGTADSAMGEGIPVAIDLMIRILTEEGTRRLAALEANQATGEWWSIVEANSLVFTRRVALLREGL